MSRTLCLAAALFWFAGIASPAPASLEEARRIVADILSDSGIQPVECHKKLTRMAYVYSEQICAKTEMNQIKFRKAWDRFMAVRSQEVTIGRLADWHSESKWGKKFMFQEYKVEGTRLEVVYWEGWNQLSIWYADYSWNEWPCPEGFGQGDGIQEVGVDIPELGPGTWPAPEVPDLARFAHTSGHVTLRAIVGPDGKVTDACVSKPATSALGFEEAGINSLRKAVYEVPPDGGGSSYLVTVDLTFTVEE